VKSQSVVIVCIVKKIRKNGLGAGYRVDHIDPNSSTLTLKTTTQEAAPGTEKKCLPSRKLKRNFPDRRTIQNYHFTNKSLF